MARRKFLARAFGVWHSLCAIAMHDRRGAEIADANCRHQLLRRHFHALRWVARAAAARHMRRRMAVRLRYLALLRLGMRAWRAYISIYRAHKLERLAVGVHHHGRVVARRCIAVWLQHVYDRRVKRVWRAKAALYWMRRLMRRAIRVWHMRARAWAAKRSARIK